MLESKQTNQRFTSYERSASTGIDYAVNRSYSSGQGRFTTVDPIGMSATNIASPQSLNLYAYTQNNPIDFKDPSGLNRAAPGSGGQRGMLYTLYYGNNNDGWQALFSWFVPYGDGGGDDEGSGGGSPEDKGKDLIAKAVDRFLDIMKDGCWTPELNNGVSAKNDSFANMDANVAKDWGGSTSIHNNDTKESNKYSITVRGKEIPNPAGDVKLGNRPKQYESTTYNFVVKYYAGEGAALASPTVSLTHVVDAVKFTLGFKVNVDYAKTFLNLTNKKECKK